MAIDIANPGASAAALYAALSPRPTPKTLVIFGSSNGAGVGSSTYVSDSASWSASPATSWAGLLSAALKTIDASWSVYNRSLSGTGTAAGVARFWTDVAPLRPSHVIICMHPLNDGLDPLVVVKNTITLCNYCDMIGAIPILRGAYMYSSYTDAQYRAMLSLNRQLDILGFHRIDHFSTLDDGSGHYISPGSFDVDGLHPNDAGYAVLFSAIDLGLFVNGGAKRGFSASRGAWQANGSNGSGITLTAATGLPTNIRSFSMRARIKGVASSGLTARAFLSAAYGGSAPLRVRNASGPYDLTEAIGMVTSTVSPGSDASVHDCCMTYNGARNLAALYIDGALIGTGTPTVGSTVTEMAVGGRAAISGDYVASGYGFADVGIWNVPLSAAAVADLYRSNVKPPAGLIVDLDLTIAPPAAGGAGNVPSMVPNGILPAIGSVPWVAVAPF